MLIVLFCSIMIKQPDNIPRILLVAFILETICVTYALYLPSLSILVSVLYTLTGITIAFGLLWMKPGAAKQKQSILSFSNPLNYYRWLLMGIALLVMCRFAMQWMEDNPLEYHDADMLPIIKVMCQRFISGAWSHVYDPIPEIWHGTVPIYLPAMWLPFSIPVGLGIDPRWLTVAVLFVVLGIFLWKIDPLRKNAWVLFMCAFLLFWWLFADEKAGLLTYTEEGVIIFYYVLLTLALMKRNIWVIGICASICVLSRYALIGWLPAMVLYFGYNKEWKNLSRFAFTGITCFFILLALPFGWKIFQSLFALPESYIGFAGRVWHDAPHVFYGSLGWAKFFGPQKIAQLHYLLIFLSFAVPFLCMLIVLLLHKKYSIPLQNLPLAVLKLSLVIFYSFIDVPYLYLFYTSSFVSLVAIACFLQRERDEAVVVS
jgi:hypothetical protein